MAQRFSISNKQAVLIGLGATALIAGSILLLKQKKRKQELKTASTPKSKQSLMV